MVQVVGSNSVPKILDGDSVNVNPDAPAVAGRCVAVRHVDGGRCAVRHLVDRDGLAATVGRDGMLVGETLDAVPAGRLDRLAEACAVGAAPGW